MKCSELTTALVCHWDDSASTYQTLVAHYEYGTNASGATILTATRYTDADGVIVDTTTDINDSVTPGGCLVAPPDVEFERLCDVSAGGVVTEFFRRTVITFDINGAVDTVTVVDLELDKVTSYTPTGTVGACNEDCDAVTAQGVVNSWG